jgi:hypothetical protein
MAALAQWEQGTRNKEQGTRMRQIARQKLYGFLNWAVQREAPKAHLQPSCNASRGAEAQAHWVSPQ